MSGGAVVPSDLSGDVASPGPTSVDNTAAAPIGDAMSPAGTSPADAMSPVNAPMTASDLSGAVPPSSATGDSAGGATAGGGFGDLVGDQAFGASGPGDFNSAFAAGGSTPGTAGSGTPDQPASPSDQTTLTGGQPTSGSGGKSATQDYSSQSITGGTQAQQQGQNQGAVTAPGGGRGASGTTPQNNMQQAGNLINQLAKMMGQGGGFNAGQAQNLLNRMGVPNRGGLTFGQRAQLRMMGHQQRAAAQQALWNAGVRNPRGDSRYVGMMQSIQDNLASQAQNMMQQNFQNALASNQQLLQAAQMQMNQQTQQGNAMQSLMQALGRTAGSSSGSTVGTAGGAGSGGAGAATASA